MNKKVLLVGHSVRPIARQLAESLAAEIIIFKEDLEQAKEELLKVGFLENEIEVIPSLAMASYKFALCSGLSTKDNYLNSEGIKENVMEIKNTIVEFDKVEIRENERVLPRRSKFEDPFSRSYKGRKKKF